MKKILISILKIIFAILLILGLIFCFFSALCGNLLWLVILSIIFIIITLFTKHKYRNFVIVLIILLILIPTIVEIGAKDRNGTIKEKEYIITKMSDKYNITDVEILNLKFSNEKLIGLENLLQFNTYKWNNFKATMKDNKGLKFNVYGYNDGFNNIISMVDDYFVVKTVKQYSNDIYDIDVDLWEKTDSYWSSYYVSLSYKVNYKNNSKREFDRLQELSHIENVKNGIYSYNFTYDVRLYITYEFNDGDINFKYNKFVYD